MADSWYVVHTKPRQELLAAALLEQRLGLNVYFPEVLERKRGQRVRSPFFPGYLFVNVDLSQTRRSLVDATPGVIRLVSSQGEPCALPTEVVACIRHRVERINFDGGLPVSRFHPGDAVRITTGPLQGMEGLFAGPLTPSERVSILLHFMGTERHVTVPDDSLEPSHSYLPAPTFEQKRRSRGIGRPILGVQRNPIVS